MDVTRQHIVDMLRRMGFEQVADEAVEQLPDPVDFDHAAAFLGQYGITKDEMISMMGGSP